MVLKLHADPDLDTDLDQNPDTDPDPRLDFKG